MDKAVEAMRLIRVPPVGKLMIEIGGKRYLTVAEIPNSRQRQMALAAIGELIVAADGYQTIVDAGFAPPIQPKGSTAGEEEPLTARQQKFLESLRGNDDAEDPFPTSSVSNSAEVVPAVDMVTEIDKLVQKRVRAERDLRGDHVRIERSPTGGLRINVNGVYYEDVVEIDHPLIRFAVKMSIQEWEQENT